MHRALRPGETLRLDTGCLVALTSTVTYDVQLVGGVKNTLFGGEGLFLATLTGPGRNLVPIAALLPVGRKDLGQCTPARRQPRGRLAPELGRRPGRDSRRPVVAWIRSSAASPSCILPSPAIAKRTRCPTNFIFSEIRERTHELQ